MASAACCSTLRTQRGGRRTRRTAGAIPPPTRCGGMSSRGPSPPGSARTCACWSVGTTDSGDHRRGGPFGGGPRGRATPHTTATGTRCCGARRAVSPPPSPGYSEPRGDQPTCANASGALRFLSAGRALPSAGRGRLSGAHGWLGVPRDLRRPLPAGGRPRPRRTHREPLARPVLDRVGTMKRTRREPAVYVEIIHGALVPVAVPLPGPPYTITYAVGDFTFG